MAKILEETALGYSDVLITPKEGQLESRKQASLRTYFSRSVSLSSPVVASAMDTVTNATVARIMASNGGLGIIHRFQSIDDQFTEVINTKKEVAAAVGSKGDYLDRAKKLLETFNLRAIVLDVAYANTKYIHKSIEELKKVVDESPDVDLVVGNVATYEGARSLAQLEVDGIRCGIGPGRACTTRYVTGCGVPMITSIMECREAIDEIDERITLIADGGVRHAGDIVKAIGAGADCVMVGSLIAATNEAPSEMEGSEKVYRGMSRGSVPEGEALTLEPRGKLPDLLFQLNGGVRSGISYAGANSIATLKGRAKFIKCHRIKV